MMPCGTPIASNDVEVCRISSCLCTRISAKLALLIEQLREEGALLQHQENTLLIRPTHWQQVDRLSPHWKALLLFLQTNENGEDNGSGRST